MNIRKVEKKGLTLKVLAGLVASFGVFETAGAGSSWAAHAAAASTLRIPLTPASRLQKISTTYTCSGSAALLDKLPKPFVSVTYLNAGAVSLAVLQVEGETQVFSNVISASGARYTANRFEWWSKGNTAFFSEVGAEDTYPLTCQETDQAAVREGR